MIHKKIDVSLSPSEYSGQAQSKSGINLYRHPSTPLRMTTYCNNNGPLYIFNNLLAVWY